MNTMSYIPFLKIPHTYCPLHPISSLLCFSLSHSLKPTPSASWKLEPMPSCPREQVVTILFISPPPSVPRPGCICRLWQITPSPASQSILKRPTVAHMSWQGVCVNEESRSLSFISFMVNLFLIKRQRKTELGAENKMLSRKKRSFTEFIWDAHML